MQRLRLASARLSDVLLLCLAMLPAALFVYLGHFSRPAGDDFEHIRRGREQAPIENALYWRDVWGGAYSDYFLHSLLGPLDWAAAAALPALSIMIWIPALAWLLWQLLGYWGLGRRLSLSLSLAALTVGASCNALFSPEALYWFSANVRYTFPLGLCLGYLACMLALGNRLDSRRGLAFAGLVSWLICFATGGFSEVHLIFQVACLAALLAVLIIFLPGRLRWKAIAMLGGGLLGSLASGVAQWTAPGRAIRTEWALNYPRVYGIRDPAEFLNLAIADAHRLLMDPQALAGCLLLFGAGFCLALRIKRLILPAGFGERVAALDGRLLYIVVLVIQLIMLPALWTHRSDEAVFFGRFSMTFMAALIINSGLIVACLLAVWRYRQHQALLRGRRWLAAFSLSLTLFALALLATLSLRGVTILARNAMFLASLSLLALAWQEWSRDKLARSENWLCLTPLFFTGMALLIAALLIAVPRYFLGSHHEVALGRRLSGAAFLLVSQGLVWGFALGYACRRLPGKSRARLQLAGLLIGALAYISILSGQLRLLPDFQVFALEWDERHALLLELRDMGQRDAAIPPREFSLWAFIRLGVKVPEKPEPLAWMKNYYGFDSIIVVDDG